MQHPYPKHDFSHYLKLKDKNNDFVYLDIETTGLSRYYHVITTVGYFYKGIFYVWVNGGDDTHLRETLSKAKGIVTFNGSLFDLPFMLHHMGDIKFPPIHLDLRYVALRAKLTGGQKAIESILSIDRYSSLTGKVNLTTGKSAPGLWFSYIRGNDNSLRDLIEYNKTDVLNMYHIGNIVSNILENNKRKKSLDFKNHKIETVIFNKDKREMYTERIYYKDLPIDHPIRIVGIDLTGSVKRDTGVALLIGRVVTTDLLTADDDIINYCVTNKADLVSIDSPLTRPMADEGIMRYSERILKKRGVNVYPAYIPSMVGLTNRGINLATRLKSLGFKVIESFPGAAQDIMGIPRKREGLDELIVGLSRFGLEGDFNSTKKTHDEIDAITSAVVGLFYLSDRYESLGRPDTDEALIIPRIL